jgi:hypothetical protein
MALKPQSIRNNQTILVDGRVVEKEEIIKLSESWSEKQESFFKKMLKQAGKFKINGVYYEIHLKEQIRRTDGETDKGVTKVPGESARI